MNSFRLDGRALRYTLEEAGQALLFVHGLGGRAENWLLQRAAFAPVRRVLVDQKEQLWIDLRQLGD